MVTVPWAQLQHNEKQYASLVSTLLLRLRPLARVVDGSGGDRGKDVFEYDEDNRLIIYELKSFTGRLTGSRRRQVESSLCTAAQHQPDAWDLIAPVHLTDREWAWFDDLRKEYPFVRNMHGLHWLNEQLARHEDLVRSVLHTTDTYLLDRIAEVRAEEAVMSRGVPDLVARQRTLLRRADELSPHYRLSVSADEEGNTQVAIAPKDLRSTGAAPVVVTGNIVFSHDDPDSSSEQRRYEQAITYGEDLELQGRYLRGFRIDAPPELGISGPLPLDALRLEAQREPLEPVLGAQLSVMGSLGEPVQSIPLFFRERTWGVGGTILRGTDLTGLLSLRVQVKHADSTWGIELAAPDTQEYPTPSAALPVLRLLAAARSGAVLCLTIGPRAEACTFQATVAEDWMDDRFRIWVDLCEDLRFIQDSTNVHFPIPGEITAGDAAGVHQAARLLSGEAISIGIGPIALEVQPTAAQALERFSTGPQRLVRARDLTLVLGSWAVDIGTCVEYCTISGASNLAEARRDIEAGRSTKLLLDLPDGEKVLRQLLKHAPDAWLPPALAVRRTVTSDRTPR
ncbi:hypothetical protein WEB32_30810 [Streptomyces netropsis]|uniref:hypothetical protein n=1 Tax=Streptomyces netropsis TaxID=55404 RepID=UPI0030CD6DE6